jgi:cyclic beta-1,2-glucan synthetase
MAPIFDIWKNRDGAISGRRQPSEEQPLRGELFSIDQLRDQALALAESHEVLAGTGANRLLARLGENEKILREYNEQTLTVEKKRHITPAAEWLLDNFYLIEEQIHTTRRHLPRRFNRELPHLIKGPSAGYPRVYDIASNLISHVDGRLDADHLSSFVAAYQRVTSLKLGELWAIPIMLRLALIENLRRLAVQLSSARAHRDLADEWTDRLTETAERNPSKLIVVVAQMAESEVVLSQAFVAEFWRRSQAKSPMLQLALSWIEQHLVDAGLTIEQLVHAESQSQAANQVSVGNSITSLRFLDAMDWKEFVETLSIVEQTLRTDPVDVYSGMDFHTRDLYRHGVERIARYSKLSEGEVALQAVELARQAQAESKNDPRHSHVGYYLLNKGLEKLESAAGMRLPLRDRVQKVEQGWPLSIYLGSILVLSALMAAPLLMMAWPWAQGSWAFPIFALLPVVCIVHLSVSLVNWLASISVPPRLLARMDFSDGIPAEHRTVVVVPTLLSSSQGIDSLLDGIEVRYLANRDENLYFALLTDYRDAPQETVAEDEGLLCRIREGVLALNKKYETDRPSIFFLLHRPRRWNASEGVWMGYERKRGKLEQFNAFLRGRGRENFFEIIGDDSLLQQVQYVITLDTDTQLPRDAARQLVGTMAHPLNRPKFDPSRGRVVEGYSILQPRVAVSLSSATRSWFVRLFSDEPGVDPYTRAVSDVYQDLFQEGSFVGKGIYDVDAFEQALGGRLPENRILSHDLLESAYARSALVSDVQFYEEFPSRYTADMSRRHRWIRGDWQIATWLLPRVPGADVRRVRNPLSGLSRWKVFDNLRRSLVPIALLVLLLAGQWLLGGPTGIWQIFVVGIIVLPIFFSLCNEFISKPKEMPFLMHLRSLGPPLVRQAGQALLTLIFLPYDAYVCCDAILRTLLRMTFTRRRLLEWQTASDTESSGRTDLASFIKSMWISSAIALGMAIYLGIREPIQLNLIAPLLSLWFLSPVIAWIISRPLQAPEPALSPEQWDFLQKLARKTWRYFQTFVGPGDNWLPPDNYQEHPSPVIAARTSPTNIGISMLSTLAAYDFGYVSAQNLIMRTANTLQTLGKLERHRSHFYNWYNTRTLEVLHPHYISTVDNGNLAGHLLTLGPGLLELADRRILPTNALNGLRTTLRVLLDLARHGPSLDRPKTAGPVLAGAFSQIEKVEARFSQPPATLASAWIFLNHILKSSALISSELAGLEDPELRWWCHAFEQECRDHKEDLEFIAPWLLRPEISEHIRRLAAADKRWEKLQAGWRDIEGFPTLRTTARLPDTFIPILDELLRERKDDETTSWAGELRDACAKASERASERIRALESLAGQCREFADMDFTLLYDESRNLFSIGYNVSNRRLDPSYYDLLASEARLASFVAIAQGQVKQEHWFALGRLLTSAGGAPSLISWSGSMFEYLMPLLVMPTYENTLLDASYKAAIGRQIEYGKQRGVPWGLSESGYNTTDAQLNYQYRAFGVPGLGFKRGLADDLVIAPYASVMALMVAPEEACQNLQRLAQDGREGIYGFYEAVDYTPSRVPRGQQSATVRSFMAHHKGMSFLSLTYLLLDRPMQRRFESNPEFRASELLLQERVPKETSMLYPHELEVSGQAKPAIAEATMRVFTNPNLGPPEVHLLSNGRYHVMVSNAGGGYSRWKDTLLTRWREDPTRDCFGLFFYLRDVASGEFWSAAHQPTVQVSKNYEAIFSQGRAEFRQRHEDLDIHTEICVSPEDDIEIRRVTVCTRSREARTIEVTSFAEVVLNTMAADMAHPAFSNLFVQTQILPQRHAILCYRRPRSNKDSLPWMFHLMLLQGTEVNEASYESDRGRFIGRGRTAASPAAMGDAKALSNSEGPVLDPALAIRRTVKLGSEEPVRFTIVCGVAATKEGALALIDKYQDQSIADRVIELAWTHGLVVLRHLNATEPDAQLFGRLASALLYTNNLRRAPASVLGKNRRGQRSLWSYGISGDLPIVLIRSTSVERLDLIRQVLQAHAYWRMKGLAVDLVILNQEASVYRQPLHEQIIGLVMAGLEGQMLDKPGGIFVRRADQLSQEDQILFQASARIVLSDENGTLEEQLSRRLRPELAVPSLPARSRVAEPPEQLATPTRDLAFFNGCGGFTQDGREYVIILAPGANTPAPWVNVLANSQFGTVISESGGAYTWGENCHEFRLTPWHNDPVSDVTGEALYIRDEQSGQFWSPTPLPARGKTPYIIRHGFGYSVFEHTESGISSELHVYVAIDKPVKFAVLKLRNQSGRPRQLSVSGYWEWVLGELRQKNLMHVATEIDPRSGAVLARNLYNTDFESRVAFIDVNETGRTVTGDRAEFIGRNGTFARPAAMGRARLSGKMGAGMDPCTAVHVPFELEPGQEREVVFRLGCGRNLDEAQNLIQTYRAPRASRQALEAVWEYWNRVLGVVWVETPEPALNVLANGWLLYQTLSCRMWGRTGFYQSGGAFGFRDQLQDAMALVHAEPALLREQLLRAAGHQFREGDVQHWWHPPTNRGVRTHFSDDYLWLPYAACRYVNCLGDTGVLDERVPFLEGRALRPEEEAYYDQPQQSSDSATLYEHCIRAIQYGLKFGAHGLPLIGCGDWNDGMNLIGEKGKGESVWLAFFLYDVLNSFAELAKRRNDSVFAEECLSHAQTLRRNIEKNAWDGQWYRRAYFDNGEPLGSATNPECQIDALPQSWSIISGAGDPERARTAMEAVDQHLVRRKDKVIQLFHPPFDSSHLEPGYIKGYLPGVRENGGQYTHAAIWTVMAFAMMGDYDRAWELFLLINPVLHGDSPKKISTYKVEPYVIAADVYGVAPHTGRGGWTWYTGSAGWAYRLIVETLLGLRLDVDKLHIRPRLPAQWPAFKMHYRYRQTFYHISILNVPMAGDSKMEIIVDGEPKDGDAITLSDDRKEHAVEVRFPRAGVPSRKTLEPAGAIA